MLTTFLSLGLPFFIFNFFLIFFFFLRKKRKGHVFLIIQLKYFHDSLNIALNLAPDCEFFSARYALFPLRFEE